jgi:hypothetical protein
MKLNWLVALAVTLALPALASAKKPVVASGEGYLLFREVGSDCQVAVTDVDLDLENVPVGTPITVKWNIDSRCPDSYKVAIGRFTTRNDKVKPVLDCAPGDSGGGAISCSLNWDCPDKRYKLSVCVDGAVVVDPELRIKGRGGLGATHNCPNLNDSDAYATCEGKSQP